MLRVLATLAAVAGFCAQSIAQEQPMQEPLLRIEPGMHAAMVRRVSASADGKYIVSGSEDRTARLWSVADGTLLRTFRLPIGPGLGGAVYSVAISPDGSLVAVGGYDASIDTNHTGYAYIFRAADGILVRRLGPFPDTLTEMEFSHDGERLAIGVRNGFGLTVWSAQSGQLLRSDHLYDNGIYGLDFDAIGRLASTSTDGNVRLYDENLNLIAGPRKPAHVGIPWAIAFSPDGTKLAVGYTETPMIDILSATTLDPLYSVDTGGRTTGDHFSLAWSKWGDVIYGGGRFNADSAAYPERWAEGGHGPLQTLMEPVATVMDYSPLPDGRVAFGTALPAVGYFDRNGKAVIIGKPPLFDLSWNAYTNFRVSPDGGRVWYASNEINGQALHFDFEKGPLEAPAGEPEGYLTSRITGLDIQDWHNSYRPLLNGNPLKLEEFEMTRSLAITPDATGFIIGSDWAIRRFDAAGRQVWWTRMPAVAWNLNLSADGRIVISAHADGTVRWRSAETGRELLALAVLRDGRWIAWTPKGYYSASPNGEDIIGWHLNGKTWNDTPDFFPAAQFHAQFYRPDIISLVLRLGDEERAIEQANAVAKRKDTADNIEALLPPVVEIVTPVGEVATSQNNISLKFRLRSPSGKPVNRVDVQIDGRPVEARAAQIVPEEYSTETDNGIDVVVPNRDSEVSLIAYIDDVPSVPSTLKVKWTGASSLGPKPKLYALVVGVSNYRDPDLRLLYADKDATAIAEALSAQKGHFYDDVSVKLLTDDDATEENIEIELSKLKKKTGPNDYAIVFMAGHGVTDDSLDFYFLPANADLDPDKLAATAIDGDVIRKGLSKIQGKVVLFMDACHSARGISGGTGQVDMTGLANSFSREDNGIVMYSSSTGREVSYESAEWGHGAFTKALLDIFSDQAAYGEDGKLSISELDEFLTTRVEQLTEGRQNAVMTKPSAFKRFFLASRQ
jgi:WD40 repeat protein